MFPAPEPLFFVLSFKTQSNPISNLKKRLMFFCQTILFFLDIHVLAFQSIFLQTPIEYRVPVLNSNVSYCFFNVLYSYLKMLLTKLLHKCLVTHFFFSRHMLLMLEGYHIITHITCGTIYNQAINIPI